MDPDMEEMEELDKLNETKDGQKSEPLISDETAGEPKEPKVEIEEKEQAEHVGIRDNYRELMKWEIYRATTAEVLATLFFVYFLIMGISGGIAAFPFASPAATATPCTASTATTANINSTCPSCCTTVTATTGVGCCPGGLHTFLLVYVYALILLCIYAFAPISGAHFNPAVTFTLLLARRVTLTRALFYIAAQMVGGIAGAGFAYLTLPEELRGNLNIPQPGPDANAGNAILAEIMATFGLLFGTFATAFDPRGWGHAGPFFIALIVAVNANAVGFISGACMNPARAFGTAVITGVWDYQYVYWVWPYGKPLVGPIVGGALGGVIYEYLYMTRKHSRPHGVPSTSGDNHRRDFKVKQEKVD